MPDSMAHFIPTIGILALQGCVSPHARHLEAAGARVREVRRADDFEGLSGIILPGGESTTMLKIVAALELDAALASALKSIPVWGICAGAILIARLVDQGRQHSFSLLDIDVSRNAYGRQLSSFNASIKNYNVAFIRAPKITRVGPSVRILATCHDEPVWLEQDTAMVTTFHPELTAQFPSPMHRHFVAMVRGRR